MCARAKRQSEITAEYFAYAKHPLAADELAPIQSCRTMQKNGVTQVHGESERRGQSGGADDEGAEGEEMEGAIDSDTKIAAGSSSLYPFKYILARLPLSFAVHVYRNEIPNRARSNLACALASRRRKTFEPFDNIKEASPSMKCAKTETESYVPSSRLQTKRNEEMKTESE